VWFVYLFICLANVKNEGGTRGITAVRRRRRARAPCTERRPGPLSSIAKGGRPCVQLTVCTWTISETVSLGRQAFSILRLRKRRRGVFFFPSASKRNAGCCMRVVQCACKHTRLWGASVATLRLRWFCIEFRQKGFSHDPSWDTRLSAPQIDCKGGRHLY
jgi:hypothetical protein